MQLSLLRPRSLLASRKATRRPSSRPAAVMAFRHDPKPEHDPHMLQNVDVDPLHSDPGDLGRVAEGVLDYEMKQQPHHRVVRFRTPAAAQPVASTPSPPPAPAHHDHEYYMDPHHLANVDVDPMETDPGDLGRVAAGVLEEYEHLEKKEEV